jgi:hypothetical protein
MSYTAQTTSDKPADPSLVSFGAQFPSSYYSGFIMTYGSLAEDAWEIDYTDIYYGYKNISMTSNYSVAKINTESNLALIVDSTTWAFLSKMF